jgi:signal peptidase
VGLYFAAGFAVGFGQNANAFTPTLLVANSLFVTATLLGTELSRAWLLGRSRRGRWFFRMIFIAFSYTLLSLFPARLPPLQDGLRPVLLFLGTVFIPLFTEHFFASFLSLWGGALPALTYRGVITAFSWFSPILPNADWTFEALIGTAVPAVGLAIAGEATARTRGETSLRGWAILSAAVTAVTWFILGLFPARPVVIFGSSMVPALSVGDVAVVVKADPGSLREGDIIAYQAERRLVVHRISSISREEGRAFFVTKGDATGHPDDKPVEPHQVAGRVVCVVRKVGWGAIYLKALCNSFGQNSLP